MQIVAPRPAQTALMSPKELPNLAAWFDALDTRTMLSGDGSTITDGGAVALWGDKSGNGGVNVLAIPTPTSNSVSVPHVAAFDGATELDFYALLNADALAAANTIYCGQYLSSGDQRAFYGSIGFSGAGIPHLIISSNGTAAGIQQISASAAVPYSALQWFWVRTTWRASDQRVQFFTAPFTGYSAPSSWTQLGTNRTLPGSISALPTTTALLHVGNNANLVSDGFAGRCAYFSAGVAIDGAAAVTINFSTAGKKLANGDKFTCATGQEVTLNSSGATGARIAGERDWFQGTAGSRGTFNLAGHYVSTDGTDDYYKTPLFSLPQPVTLYAVLEQTTWTSGDYLFDGGASDTLALIQTTTTPQINLSAGSSVAANTDLAVETKALVTIVSNGSSSLVSINRLPATTGNAGAGVPNGLTLASKGTAGSYGNARYYEIAVYRAAHDQATRHRFALYAARKWGFAV